MHKGKIHTEGGDAHGRGIDVNASDLVTDNISQLATAKNPTKFVHSMPDDSPESLDEENTRTTGYIHYGRTVVHALCREYSR
jgi:hypothetical protein